MDRQPRLKVFTLPTSLTQRRTDSRCSPQTPSRLFLPSTSPIWETLPAGLRGSHGGSGTRRRERDSSRDLRLVMCTHEVVRTVIIHAYYQVPTHQFEVKLLLIMKYYIPYTFHVCMIHVESMTNKDNSVSLRTCIYSSICMYISTCH